jgi:hypothetical protein
VHNDFDACKKSLELALEYGNLPDEDEIKSDADMKIAKTKPWFDDFSTTPDFAKKPLLANVEWQRV